MYYDVVCGILFLWLESFYTSTYTGKVFDFFYLSCWHEISARSWSEASCFRGTIASLRWSNCLRGTRDDCSSCKATRTVFNTRILSQLYIFTKAISFIFALIPVNKPQYFMINLLTLAISSLTARLIALTWFLSQFAKGGNDSYQERHFWYYHCSYTRIFVIFNCETICIIFAQGSPSDTI